ncbi:nucleotide-diphospho-sugar transferase [Pedobacter sp. MC2016-15]|uniref:nucleotide-diphospho-sugar transferase n=1 Tax=Pedobacter sp. MC2016-15 TaxID=2994473 RepID=UPI002247623B|nr:nucleotide-diphospho-sugar transferase [Pedobacter sp. MC2016-15]MCX2478652.1 nucleotide-diphospho-sugar transferase [Pedobacter sp. MC2016-15]
MDNYLTKSPVLFLIFNRPDTTLRVFNEIRAAKPSRLYLAADGPRAERHEEALLCQQTIDVVSQIDWPCDVKKLIRTSNLGCKQAVSSAIDWFFENEEEGIILEDDCLPAKSFFHYCDTLLEKFRYDTRIRHVTGCNLQHGKIWGNESIYFGNQTHVWGWASWRRVWADYDKDLKRYDEHEVAEKMGNIFTDAFLIEQWVRIFKDVKSGKIDTWDYQLALINYFNNSLSVNPNVNLISNIGYGDAATHTVSLDSPYASIPLEEIANITYPEYFLPEKKADYAVFNYDFKLDERWRKHNSWRRRFKRWIKTR